MVDKPIYAVLKKKIDDQQKYIADLLHQLERLRYLALVIQQSDDAVTVQDFEGNITVWNKGAEKMYGWPEARALEMNISEIVPPKKADEALLFIKDLAQGKGHASFETKRITADGRILDVWLTAVALLNEEGSPVAITTTERDITEQKYFIKEKIKLIKKLQKTNIQLEKSLAEIKTLRGIIPICMVCKQVRNDEGFWEQVEVYVHNHTEADFSHGICPNCLKEKFPKAYKKMLLSAPTSRKLLEHKGLSD